MFGERESGEQRGHTLHDRLLNLQFNKFTQEMEKEYLKEGGTVV